jgi:hypothetical protein
MIKTYLVGMSVIFIVPNFVHRKYNSSLVVSIKQNSVLNFNLSACSCFWIFCKSGLIKCCLSSEDLSAYRSLWFHVNWWKFFLHLRSLKRLPFFNGWSYETKNCGFEVTFNGITSLNLIKICQLVKKLTKMEKDIGHTHTHAHCGDLISLINFLLGGKDG